MRLNEYVTLGRTGLRVSPLCLGDHDVRHRVGVGRRREAFEGDLRSLSSTPAATSLTPPTDTQTATAKKWSASLSPTASCAIGSSSPRSSRSTREPGNPNAGGNGRKNIYRALEASLRRLNTDYIDLYYLHAWDTVTPVEEVVSTLTDLIREGKIRYYGLSDTPAWYVARAQTLAEKEGKERIATLQLEYSLDRAHHRTRAHSRRAGTRASASVPGVRSRGGFLSGKYKREGNTGQGDGRLTMRRIHIFNRFTERNWRVLDAVARRRRSRSARRRRKSRLNWVATQPGVTSTILGATKLAQLEDNLRAIEFTIPAELRKRLDEASALEPVHPYMFFAPMTAGTHQRRHHRAALEAGAPLHRRGRAAAGEKSQRQLGCERAAR